MSSFEAVIGQFLEHLQFDKGRSVHTVSNYRRDLTQLSTYLVSQSINDWAMVDDRVLRRFVGHRHAAGIQGRSLQRQLSSIRGFYRYQQRQNPALVNPADDIQAPKAPRRLPKTMEHEQVEQLLSVTDDDPLSLRDLALFELFYSSGLRLAEIAALDCVHLDLQEGTVFIARGKGAKSRHVPVGRKAREALLTWLKSRALLLKDQDEQALFLNRYGNRLGHRGIQKRLNTWAERQGLLQNIHPHRLRHAFASHLLESSGDIRAVQELLGHANLSTTQVYTHLDFQRLANVYDQAHPRARKKDKS